MNLKNLLCFFFLLSGFVLAACNSLVLPQDPTQSSNEFECVNKCAAVGMRGVFVNQHCGCEKR